ncbi:MAG TPA: hypothetical protein VNO54_28960 [Streptosporangiaceae bacterium]|nr:hypothetical protein [Streptosporangiaceae bacterium]
MSDNDAEELLPVTAFEKVIKTTIRQAASPVTRQDMWVAYKAVIPGRHGHRLTRGYGQDKHETHSGPASPCVEALARPRRRVWPSEGLPVL